MNIATGTLTRKVYEIGLLNEQYPSSDHQTKVCLAISELGIHIETAEKHLTALASENAKLREDKERIGHRADRLFERASIVVHNLGALKTHYLQHVRLDNVRPEELASQIGYERDQLEAVLNESPEHIVPPPVLKDHKP